MVFKNLIMKKIHIILLAFLYSTSYAQNLEFNQVIDTVLILDIGNTQQNISTKYLGQTISPPSGKVWKVNNILLDPGSIVNNYVNGIYDCFSCDDPTHDRNDLKFGVDINDGANDIDIRLITPSVGPTTVHNAGYPTSISFPLWVNSGSVFRTFIIQNNDYQPSSTSDICVRNVFAKAYFSIIEFNIE